MIEAREFGASLRRERERRGIRLDEIAEQTKVSVSMLAALERGDLSRWPSGIFRRSFVRAYAAAVGVDVEETFAEFSRIFPEDGGPVRPRSGGAAASMRLSLGKGPNRQVEFRRLAAAGIDLIASVVAAGLGWLLGGVAYAALGAAVVTVVWHAAGTVLWGTTPGLHLVIRHKRQPARIPATPPAPSQSEDQTDVERMPATQTIVGASRRRIARRERPSIYADRSHGSDVSLRH